MDATIFHKKTKSIYVTSEVYVDDIFFTQSDLKGIEKFKTPKVAYTLTCSK